MRRTPALILGPLACACIGGCLLAPKAVQPSAVDIRSQGMDLLAEAAREAALSPWYHGRSRLLEIIDLQIWLGEFDAARRTVAGIAGDEQDLTRRRIDEAARAAEAASRPATGAARTHQRTDRRDDLQTPTGDFAAMSAEANAIANPSTRARTLLEVATAQARAGDRRGTLTTAARTKSLHHYKMGHAEPHFDYGNPATWGEQYEADWAGCLCTFEDEQEAAAGVAAAAVRLSVAFGTAKSERFPEAFRRNSNYILHRTAAAQVAAGDLAGALLWARRMPAPAQRAAALIGAAEGLLGAPSVAHVSGYPYRDF